MKDRSHQQIMSSRPTSIKEILERFSISFRKFRDVMCRYGIQIKSPFDTVTEDVIDALIKYFMLLQEINKPRIISDGAPKKRKSRPHPLSNYKHVYVRFINCPM